MRMIHTLLLLAVLLILTSCLATKDKPKVVILQNPETMDFQDCKVADWGSQKAFSDNEACVKKYQQQGYIIWGSR